MYYVSTRDSSLRLTGAQAIVQGLSRDGGLLLPETIPQLAPGALDALARLPYPARAAAVMAMYLEEFTEDELRAYAEKAYGPAKFDTPAVAPLVKVGERGQIVIPKQAREIFGIRAGDELMLIGDEESGLAILTSEQLTQVFRGILGQGGGQNGSD